MSDLFVPHFTLDGIVTALSVLAGGVAFLFKVGKELNLLSMKVQEHGARLERLVEIAEMQIRHEERLTEIIRRINTLEGRYDEIRHGEGFVLPLPMGRKPKEGT